MPAMFHRNISIVKLKYFAVRIEWKLKLTSQLHCNNSADFVRLLG